MRSAGRGVWGGDEGRRTDTHLPDELVLGELRVEALAGLDGIGELRLQLLEVGGRGLKTGLERHDPARVVLSVLSVLSVLGASSRATKSRWRVRGEDARRGCGTRASERAYVSRHRHATARQVRLPPPTHHPPHPPTVPTIRSQHDPARPT